jgi:hypothetical protein
MYDHSIYNLSLAICLGVEGRNWRSIEAIINVVGAFRFMLDV